MKQGSCHRILKIGTGGSDSARCKPCFYETRTLTQRETIVFQHNVDATESHFHIYPLC